uniref:CSON005495 protein n=1 Tax=Culicoides sonorensis TaxID=179676 RepID=A0A336MRJ4_CULSO
MYILGCFGILIATIILIFMQKKVPKIFGHYSNPEWNFFLKRWYAERIVRKIKKDQDVLLKYEKNYDNEYPKLLPSSKSSESQFIYGCDMNGNYLLLKFTRFQHRIAELWLVLRLEDGTTFTLPEHPDTRVCNATPNKFEAHGLTLENLVPYSKWRIRFSGLLRRGVRREFSELINENELEFVRFNFFWNACSVPQHWPFDWSPKLMATALALEPWRDGNWKFMLNKADSGGYDQFGALKGRIFIQKNKIDFSSNQNPDENFTVLELNLPGIRQRRWGPSKTSHLHRTASFVGVLQDGTVFELGAFSSKTGLTHCQFGNFRTPYGKVFSLT